MKLKELKEKRSALAARMHEIHKTAEEADRGLNDEERSEFDAKGKEIAALDIRIKDGERAEQLAREAEALNDDNETEGRQRHNEGRRSYQDDPNRPLNSVEGSRALVGWAMGAEAPERDRQLAERAGFSNAGNRVVLELRRGGCLADEEPQAPRTIAEAREQSAERRRQEREAIETRAQSTLTAGAGLATVPDAAMRTLEIALLAFGGMRRVAEVLSTTTGAEMPIPTTNDTNQKGEIITENTEVNDQDVAFAQVLLNAFLYSSKSIRVSYQLMQDSATNMASLIGRLAGERIGRIQNEHFTVGTGTAQPRGITLDAVDSTITAGTAGVLAWDELLALKHSVDPAYRAMGASWMVHDSILLRMKQIKDADGRPLWLPSLVSGGSDLFDGDPVEVNQDMPVAAASKGVLYGCLDKYLIREVRSFEIMRLNELYARFHQVGFQAFGRADGRLIDAGTGPVKFLTLA